MAPTLLLTRPLLALQVSRPITAHTWPPHGLSTWYTPINRDSDPPAYDSRPGTSVLRDLGLYTISHGTGRNPSHYSSRATTALYFSYFIISLQARLDTVATRLCYSFYTRYNTASMHILSLLLFFFKFLYCSLLFHIWCPNTPRFLMGHHRFNPALNLSLYI